METLARMSYLCGVHMLNRVTGSPAPAPVFVPIPTTAPIVTAWGAVGAGSRLFELTAPITSTKPPPALTPIAADKPLPPLVPKQNGVARKSLLITDLNTDEMTYNDIMEDIKDILRQGEPQSCERSIWVDMDAGHAIVYFSEIKWAKAGKAKLKKRYPSVRFYVAEEQ
jgi:hypothetical protein